MALSLRAKQFLTAKIIGLLWVVPSWGAPLQSSPEPLYQAQQPQFRTEQPSQEIGSPNLTEESVYFQPPVRDSYSRQFGFNLAASIPNPVLTAEYRPNPYLSFGLGGGILPISYNPSKYGSTNNSSRGSFWISGIQATVRFHPWGRSMFLGLTTGVRNIGASESDKSGNTYGANLARTHLTPHLGWNWVLDSGVSIGTEFGVEIPFSSTPSVIASGPNYDPSSILYQTAIKAANDSIASYGTGNFLLPYITFIKIGYMF